MVTRQQSRAKSDTGNSDTGKAGKATKPVKPVQAAAPKSPAKSPPKSPARKDDKQTPAFDDNQNKDNLAAFSVSELANAIKQTVESGFGHVRVRGEIGRVARPDSGHVYLDLKDEKAVLAAVIWKPVAQKLTAQPQEGLEVICTGRLTTFAPQSRYQLIVEHIEPAGVGALMALLETRKQTLAAEGLFAPERKKPLPYLPEIIGVITSPSGAVIRDILHRLADRFPRHVLVWPVRVQGKTCADEVARAIAGFNMLGTASSTAPSVPRPDLLIVARGGGSLEDLWGFNEEIVARTAAQSDIPLISAIGHETDTSLLDFAADCRAPTPSAAAEMAVPVRADLQAQIMDLHQRQWNAQIRLCATRKERLKGFARGLPRLENILANPRQRFDYATSRLHRVLSEILQNHANHLARLRIDVSLRMLYERIKRAFNRLDELGQRNNRAYTAVPERARLRLLALGRQLDLLSHESILARGFALVLDKTGKLIHRAAQAPIGSLVNVQLARGEGFSARVEAAKADTSAATQNMQEKDKEGIKKEAKKEPNIKKQKTNQGDLF